MGFYFSNMQIRLTEACSEEAVTEIVTELMLSQGFHRVEKDEDADITVSFYAVKGSWLSVCSDGISFETEEAVRRYCQPISQRLAADVVTVSCFDSDCLLLHRLNSSKGIEAWAKVGRYPGIKQRTTLAKWKDLVTDADQWAATCKADYVFAEDALEKLEPLLALAPEQGRFCSELLAEGQYDGAKALGFALPETEKPELPALKLMMPSLMPCEIGKDCFVSAVNTGGKSFGLAIIFSGSYVEKDEIRFRDVQLESDFERHPRPTVPVTLEKRKMQDGQWVYYGEAPQFQILPAAKVGLPMQKAMREQFKRAIGLRFTPEGDGRKRLDITVHIIPLRNPAGQCAWCVWHFFGSKQAFVQHHNQTWSALQPYGAKLLNENELELDD